MPKYAYTEQIAVRDFRDSSKQASSSDLNEAYEKLVVSIAQLAPNDSRIGQVVGNNLDFKDKTHLVELLLKSPSIKDVTSRRLLLAELPFGIKESNNVKTHVLNIVNSCKDHYDGFDNLIEVLRFFDGKTEPFQKLTEFINTLDGFELK